MIVGSATFRGFAYSGFVFQDDIAVSGIHLLRGHMIIVQLLQQYSWKAQEFLDPGTSELSTQHDCCTMYHMAILRAGSAARCLLHAYALKSGITIYCPALHPQAGWSWWAYLCIAIHVHNTPPSKQPARTLGRSFVFVGAASCMSLPLEMSIPALQKGT